MNGCVAGNAFTSHFMNVTQMLGARSVLVAQDCSHYPQLDSEYGAPKKHHAGVPAWICSDDFL